MLYVVAELSRHRDHRRRLEGRDGVVPGLVEQCDRYDTAASRYGLARQRGSGQTVFRILPAQKPIRLASLRDLSEMANGIEE